MVLFSIQLEFTSASFKTTEEMDGVSLYLRMDLFMKGSGRKIRFKGLAVWLEMIVTMKEM